MIWLVMLVLYLAIGIVLALLTMIDTYSKKVYWLYGLFVVIFWLPLAVTLIILQELDHYKIQHDKIREDKMCKLYV